MSAARLDIEGELTIYVVHELKDRLLAAFPPDGHLRLDLTRVAEADGAGLQLLLSAEREAEARGGRLIVAGASPVVREMLALANRADLIDDDAPAAGTPAGADADAPAPTAALELTE
ncbi:STAS domain-containing protein [Derxia gummosa]|uniref:STAS domain-containing protein n=1 Tax=Derxia gummosa DSM 723 TaxID=1121388 RepID=A0A8B6XA25_9BURK|nr:STAS domain-containing protein [Derxia gummosa]